MAKKDISDYMHKDEPEKRLVQASVNKELFNRFRPLLKAEKPARTFIDFLEACMLKYIDEKKR